MSSGKNYLFLIGIDKYQNQEELFSCVKDCKDFRDILIDKFDFSSEQLVELYDEQATNYKIQEELKGCIKALTEDNNLIIYYSGHGGLEHTTKRGFWVPQDGAADNYTTWIPNETLLTYIEQIKAKHIFIISDCCFARSILIKGKAKSTDLVKDYDFYSSRWALTSGADQTWDGGIDENSYFAESILECLKECKEDLRIGKLIEYVKSRFNANIRQKPQGYPLHTIAHRGGEFIFKIINADQETGKEIKGYKDFLKTLQLYKRSSKFREIATVNEQKVGYQIFMEYDEVMKKASYFLYLYEGTVQNKTYDHIKSNHPEILKDKSLIILLPKEKGQIKTEIRKSNFDRLLSPLSIFYIDDFLRSQCTPINISNDNDKYLDIENFIPPFFNYNNQKTNSWDILEAWFDSENKPILVLKGTGGIGKTTFAQFLCDKFVKKREATVIFIDSSEIFNELIEMVKVFDSIKLYNFYEALLKKAESEIDKLNEDELRLNIDAGNILVVIDGLDEVISKVPKFNVDVFIDSIIQYSSELGNGKIIITCRSYFWNAENYKNDELQIAELLPFNADQSNQFFSKSFGEDKKKIEKAEVLANEFRSPSEDGTYIFHPYVLDVIRSIIQEGKDTYLNDGAFNSSMLDKDLKNDYIIFKVCQRERKRVGQIIEDDQLKFFVHFAVKKRGVISIENLKIELQDSLDKQVDNINIEAFKSHPFIQLTDKYIRFKYDFFTDYFKSIFIANCLKLENGYDKISDELINNIAENCWFGSGMTKDVVNRFTVWSDDNVLQVSDLIGQIVNSTYTESLTRKFISGLFNIALLTNIKHRGNNVDNNSYLLKSLFTKSSKVYGLSIININNNEDVIRFDFQDTILEHCFIDTYSSFWDCNFNEDTYFDDCDLFNLPISPTKKVPLSKEHFRNCRTDQTFKLIYRIDNINEKKTSEKVNEFLEDFFKLFFSKGRLERQSYDMIIKRRFPSINHHKFNLDDIMDYFKNNGIVESFKEYNELKVRVTDKYKSDIVKYIKDGTTSKMVNSSVEYLTSLVRS